VWAYDMGNCLNVASYDLITGGQKWAESDLFDVEAVIPEGDHTKAELLTMLEALLAERFKLVVHREAREMPVYALTVAMGGPKLRQVAEGDCVVRPSGDVTRSATDNKPWCGEGAVGVGFDRKGTADVRAMTLDVFCERLGLHLDRPVINKTGITGMVAFHLEWLQEEGMSAFVRLAPTVAREIAPPEIRTFEGDSIFKAIQEQVGLKLESAKGPVQTIVIDHAEKPEPN
jgi:uncharacterized protein (TIGR03435 family)